VYGLQEAPTLTDQPGHIDRIDLGIGHVIRGLPNAEALIQQVMKGRIEDRGLGEKAAILGDDLAMPREAQSAR